MSLLSLSNKVMFAGSLCRGFGLLEMSGRGEAARDKSVRPSGLGVQRLSLRSALGIGSSIGGSVFFNISHGVSFLLSFCLKKVFAWGAVADHGTAALAAEV